jgi:hypothetical protein
LPIPNGRSRFHGVSWIIGIIHEKGCAKGLHHITITTFIMPLHLLGADPVKAESNPG